MTTQNILACNDLTISRDKKIILQNINFSISTGEIIVLLGANGSGKSTLLKTIARLLPFQAGNLAILGQELGSITLGKKANLIITKEIPSLDYIPYSFGENKVERTILF